MKLLIYLLLLLTMPLAAQGKTDEKTLLDRIDKMIENDQYYQGIKEKELKHLKRQAYEAEDNQTRLLFLDSIYHAYSAYRYDSAYAYMKQGLELAEKCHNTYYILRNQINQASILSVRGFYSKAENILKSLNPDEMPYQLKLYYYFTYAWLYSYWESYSKNSDYAEEFTGKFDLYEEYLVEASVSDGLCQLKETVALQKLAYYLFKKDASNSKRAAKYIQHTMEDAQFFNNQLRMMEISNILPVIASANQQAAERSRTRFLWGFIGVSIALVIILILSLVNNRQKNKLKKNKAEIEEQNEKQKEMNAQLTELNQQLVETNIKRETYMRLFMDISAAYISKLSDYRKLVSRKIKANQTADLLKSLNTHKLEEEESQMFYNRFDKAFMELYPGFVTELNKLLLPECQMEVPTTHDLTTEIRIFALMRLGVTDSQEIATLLHYSTQTIYNYKSGMRAKAINRDTFESDINQLCHIINS